MKQINQYLQSRLQQREQNGTLRRLKADQSLADFCSNDYLGFARSSLLKQLTEDEQSQFSISNGSTGSRLLAGNSNYALALEQHLADFYKSEAALLFNSGYDANVGLFSSLPQRGDVVIHDELIHASIIDGIRLSFAQRQSFKHNDLQHLEEKLNKPIQGRVFVVVEGIYSMDGDEAPLPDIAALCKKYNAGLIVDEAHAVGVFGKGLVEQLNLEKLIFARIATFGKALGCHGAVVLGTHLLIQYLVNFARSFIYTTAAPLHQLIAIKTAHLLLKNSVAEVSQLQINIHFFKECLRGFNADYTLIESRSAIQCIIIGNAAKAKSVAIGLQQHGFDVRPILSPTVTAGTERLRICLHAFNTFHEIQLLCTFIEQLLNEN